MIVMIWIVMTLPTVNNVPVYKTVLTAHSIMVQVDLGCVKGLLEHLHCHYQPNTVETNLVNF